MIDNDFPHKALERAVCVFCASSSKVDERYFEIAKACGRLAANQRWHIVYGGAQGGLMGAVADAALDGGGQVTGVMPKDLIDKERAHCGLTQFYETKDMHERQQMMAALSLGFVVLPGGLGTLAEFFEILTWKQIGLHNKPIALVNVDGYWSLLLEMLKRAEAEEFLHMTSDENFSVLNSIQDLENFFTF